MPVFGQKKPETAAASPDTKVSFKDALQGTQGANAAENAASGEPQEENGFLSFLFGVLDVINPLQHIPVVSTIYRHLTGDEISPMARIAGDALYGGPIGAAVALADVAIESSTGKDIGGNVMAMVTGGGDEAPQTMVASAAPLQEEIIWNDTETDTQVASAQEFPQPLLPARLPQSNGAAELEPAFLSYKDAPPVSTPKGGMPYNAVLTAANGEEDEEFVPTTRLGALTALQSQEAPVDVAGTETPPELIAYKMMEALDKYSAMKKTGL